ncbi:STAS domain-containing protein [Paracoccus sp. Z118]|uniref:STAS domain-containing protein n=1 Tax=Paracoccus sp. Z118 TaxID=2851017 RepID=UPI001C2BE28F|nr:STAS domain-containing protein [Paracoccus sp. Z118]MBV0892505.1 STAS domain-containing protein [Paracoccus sp. Z118]
MTTSLQLAPRLDLPAARPLAQALLDRAGSDLTIDAGNVAHLGGLALQVLLAAERRWRADGARLTILPRSAAFVQALQLFGAAHLLPERSAGWG